MLAVAHPNPWSSASFYLPSQSQLDRNIAALPFDEIAELPARPKQANRRIYFVQMTAAGLVEAAEPLLDHIQRNWHPLDLLALLRVCKSWGNAMPGMDPAFLRHVWPGLRRSGQPAGELRAVYVAYARKVERMRKAWLSHAAAWQPRTHWVAAHEQSVSEPAHRQPHLRLRANERG